MKRNILIVLGLIFAFTSLINAHINTTVQFNSLGLDSYSLEKCSINGSCSYYDIKTPMMLEYNQDHIIKIIPKKHFSGINNDFLNKYLNVEYILMVGALFGMVWLSLWLVDFLTSKKS